MESVYTLHRFHRLPLSPELELKTINYSVEKLRRSVYSDITSARFTKRKVIWITKSIRR